MFRQSSGESLGEVNKFYNRMLRDEVRIINDVGGTFVYPLL